MANFPFAHKISQASSVSHDQKALTYAYGDGYEQRAAIGINNMFQSWNIQINGLSLEERNTLMSFWRAHGRVNSFDWTPPNEAPGKFVFASALSESNIGERYNFMMTFKQVYEV